ncbi:MAG: nuclear transport factor 2 family protein [Methylotenera sp.]|nr:nuclear transport factor 2 family protein [Methylotenera sp.]
MNSANDLLHLWVSCVNQGDIQSLLGLYSEQAILIPTFSNRMLSSKAALKSYFEMLASKEHLSISLHENTLLTQPITASIHTISGIYNWRFAVDSEVLNFEARFNYLLDLTNESPILHHHSSQIPRVL